MRRTLMAFGAFAVFALIASVSAIGYIGFKSAAAAKQNKKVAVAAVREISQTWSVAGHGHIIDASLVEAAASPEGRRAFVAWRRLGALQSASDVSQTHFSMSSETGTRATVEFQGAFTGGSAKVIVVLSKSGPNMKVIGLHTENTQLKMKPPRVSA